MKKIALGIVFVIVQLSVFSQQNYTAIKIADDVDLIKLSENAYIHVSYAMTEKWGRVGANGLLFINENQAFLFDSPWTNEQTKKLYEYITDSMNLTLVGFVPNHWHDDCMGGLEFLQSENIKSYANLLTIDLAKSNNLAIPDQGFSDSLELKLGDKKIECYYPGAAHSLDNIAIWIPSEQILFAACIIKSMGSNNLGNTADGDVTAYPKTLNNLIQRYPTAKIVIPGHGNFGGLELVSHTLELTVK